MDNDTIAGIASGMGGGVGVIRISGDMSLDIAGKVFRTKSFLNKLENDSSLAWDFSFFYKKETHTINYGYVVNQENIIDEVIVLLMKAPSSYTREDVVEIDCHGGPFIIKSILDELIKNGARLAEAGEFTKRAFLNGRIDLSQAEAVMEMIQSENHFAHQSAVQQLEGSVSTYIEEIRQEILHNIGYIEAALDDPEHIDLQGFSEQLHNIIKEEVCKLQVTLENFDQGRMRREGINTVIVGKPNAGKSSLMNLLLDEERAIVTNIAGTTRDILEERVKLGDLVLNLADTAGIHETEDIVENIGVSRAMDYIEKADFIIYIVDSSAVLEESDHKIISLIHHKKGVILLNKSDLISTVSAKDIERFLPWDSISFSNLSRQGLDELETYIKKTYLNGDISFNNQIYLTNLRQKVAIENAISSLNETLKSIDVGLSEDFFTIDMMEAYTELGLINGETASEDLVNKIFNDFCMGK